MATETDRKDDPVEANQEASAENEKQGEAPIKTYSEAVQDGKPREDEEEISSTDDV